MEHQNLGKGTKEESEGVKGKRIEHVEIVKEDEGLHIFLLHRFPSKEREERRISAPPLSSNQGER